MYTTIFLLAWLSCVGHGRRVQVPADQLQGHSLEKLATLLLARDNDVVGWQAPGNFASRSPARAPAPVHMKVEEQIKITTRPLPETSSLAIDVDMPASIANDIHFKVLKKMGRNVNVPGFQKGKVPKELLINQIGLPVVKEATVDQAVKIGLQNSDVEKSFHTMGDARLPETIEKLAKRYKIGEALDFTIEVDIMQTAPVDELKYKNLSVEVAKVPFLQEEYDKALKELQKRYALREDLPPGTESKIGDSLLIDMSGVLANPDGTRGGPLPNVASGDGITLDLEPGQFMPGLVEGVVGAKEGETREITTTFPKRSSIPELAYKTAIFDVKCLKVMNKTLLPAGEELARKVNENMTWTEMDGRMRETIDQKTDDQLKEKTYDALEQALVATLPEEFNVPETLIEKVAKERFAEMLSDMRAKGESDEKLKETITQENYDNFKKIVKPRVVATLKGQMATQAVANKEGIKPTTDQVDDAIVQLQKQFMQEKKPFKESEHRPNLEAQLERDMVYELLLKNAKVTYTEAKEDDVSDMIGQTPEELAEAFKDKVTPKKEE